MDQQDAAGLRASRQTSAPRIRPLVKVAEARSARSFDIVRDEAALLALRPAWEALHVAAGGDGGSTFNPFMSWTWTWHWWRSQASAPRLRLPRYRLHVVVLRDQTDVVRAIVPFVEARWGAGRLAVRAIRQFGFGPTTADLRSPLVWPGWEDAAADALIEALRPTRGRRAALSILDGVPGTGRLAQRLDVQAQDDGWRWGPSVPTHQVDLPAAWEPFRAGFRGHLRKSVRHGYNSLKREGHAWTFEAVTEPAVIGAALDDVFRLHAARAARDIKPRHVDYYARRSDRRAMRSIAASMATDGGIAICRLRVDGVVVAARIAFIGREAVYLHDAGADPGWSRFAVATTLTAECLRWAIERGATVAHIGTGDDPSKRRWRGRERELRRLEVAAPTVVGRMITLVQGWPRRVRGMSMAIVPLTEELPLLALL